MKVDRIYVVAGLFFALQAALLAEGTNLTASAKAPAADSKPQMQPVYPQVDYKLHLTKPGAEAVDANKITRLGPDSSQAWATLAARHEDQNPTVFHDASKHEPQLVLLSFSFGGRAANQLKAGK